MGEDGEGRGGRFGCTCLAPCPGPIDQTAELAKGKGGGRERKQEMDKASVFFRREKIIICACCFYRR